MPCRKLEVPGGVAIACTRGRQSARCSTPGCGGAGRFQCDFPLTGPKAGRTCDRWICFRCRVPRGVNVDYCRAHAAQTPLPMPEER